MWTNYHVRSKPWHFVWFLNLMQLLIHFMLLFFFFFLLKCLHNFAVKRSLLSSSVSTTRWRYNQGTCVLAYESHNCCAFKNLISTRPLNCAASRGIGHAHFRPFSKFTKCLFRTNPRPFHQFPRHFALSIYGLSWQKVIKRILIFQTILKLLNNNFLYILLKTQCCITPLWSVQMTWNPGYYFPMSH